MTFINNNRTALAVKNIGLSLIIKGMSIFITFLLIPMTLGYLNSYEYGIWLTLNSVLSWVHLLDIGLGNGLKNKLAEALAVNDFVSGKIYVSTTFFVMGVVFTSFYLLFLLGQTVINWYYILGVDCTKVYDLNSLVTLVFTFVCFGLVTKIVGNIYQAHQKTAVNDLFIFVGNVISLIIIYVLTKTTVGSLKSVALTYSAVPVMVSVIALPITFKIYPNITPSFKYVRFDQVKNLLSLGINFFLIQIACIILFMTSNVLISNIFSPAEVTPYNIAFKYFSVITFGFNIILSPIWPATSDAYAKNDFQWIKNTIKQLLFVWGGTIVIVIIMYFLAPLLYYYWIGDEVRISKSMTFWSGVYIIISTLASMFAVFINGFGKLRIQLVFSIIQTIVYIPLSIYCAHLFGVHGILIALCIVCSFSLLWSPRQFWLLLTGKAHGYWNK